MTIDKELAATACVKCEHSGCTVEGICCVVAPNSQTRECGCKCVFPSANGAAPETGAEPWRIERARRIESSAAECAQKIVDIAYRDNGQVPHRDTIKAIINDAFTADLRPVPDDPYTPFTIELSKPTEARVGSAIGLNCPDAQTRLHKVLAMRDKGDYYELDVELLLKPVREPAAPDHVEGRVAGFDEWWDEYQKPYLPNGLPGYKQAKAAWVHALSLLEQPVPTHRCNGVNGAERHGTQNKCTVCGEYREGYYNSTGMEVLAPVPAVVGEIRKLFPTPIPTEPRNTSTVNIRAAQSTADVWDECIAIAEAEKRKGLANLKRGDDSDYDEGYSEAAQLIATFIREAKARSLAASALGATTE